MCRYNFILLFINGFIIMVNNVNLFELLYEIIDFKYDNNYLHNNYIKLMSATNYLIYK